MTCPVCRCQYAGAVCPACVERICAKRPVEPDGGLLDQGLFEEETK